jgi:hypothetical protein
MAKLIGEMTPDEAKAAGVFTGSPGPGATTGGATKPAIMDTSLVDKSGKAIGALAEAALPAAFGLNKLMTGADAATSAVSGLTKGLSTVGLGSLAGVVGTVAKAFIDQKTNMDAASKELGIGGNNLGTFIRMSGEAGLTTKEFTDTIKKTDGLMSGLAGSSQRGAEAFSKVQKSLIESKVGEELNAIGISGKELADITALSLANNNKLNLKTAEGQKAAAEAAGMLATELDATSKITGVSREKLAAQMKEDEKKTANILLENQMSADQRAQYGELKKGIAGMGPAFKDLTTEMATGGVRTKEGIAQMTALGPAGTQLQSATQQMINAKTDDQKDAAKAALARAQAAVNERMSSEAYQKMYAFGTAEQKAAIDKQVQGYEGLGAAQKAAREANGDYAQGLKNQKAEAKAVQQGQKVDADGKPITDSKGAAVMDEGAKTAQALNMANRQATIMAGGMAQAMEKANASLGKSPAAIEAFNNSLKYVGSAKKMEDGRDQIAKLPANALKALGGGETDKVEAPVSGGSGGANGSRKPTAVTPKKPVNAYGEGGVVQGPELAVIAEKGPEAVIPLDKLKDVIGNVSSTISSATGSVGKSAETSAPKIKDSTTAVFDQSIKLYQERMARAVESGNAARIELETKGLERNQQALAAYTQQQLEKREGIEKLGFDAYHAKINQAKAKEVEAKVMSADELMALDKASIAKSKEAKVMSAAELIALDKANVDKSKEVKKEEVGVSKDALAKLTAEISSGGVRTAEGLKTMAAMGVDGIKLQKQVEESTAKVKEKSVGGGGGLFDMMNPKIINQKAADLEKAETAKTAPKTSDVAPKNAEEEAKKKQEAEKAKADADAKAKADADAKVKPATATAKDATLKDLNDQLIALNKHMVQLINHSESTADAAHKTAKSTAKAQGARG